LIGDFLEEHQMLEREIMRIIYDDQFRPILVKMPHQFGLAGPPMAWKLDP